MIFEGTLCRTICVVLNVHQSHKCVNESDLSQKLVKADVHCIQLPHNYYPHTYVSLQQGYHEYSVVTVNVVTLNDWKNKGI